MHTLTYKYNRVEWNRNVIHCNCINNDYERNPFPLRHNMKKTLCIEKFTINDFN